MSADPEGTAAKQSNRCAAAASPLLTCCTNVHPVLRATLLVASTLVVFAGFAAFLSASAPGGFSIVGVERRLQAFPLLGITCLAGLLSFLLPAWFVGVSVLMSKGNTVVLSEVVGEHPGLSVALVGLFIPVLVYVAFSPDAQLVEMLFIDSAYTPYALMAVAHGAVNAFHTNVTLKSSERRSSQRNDGCEN